MKDEKELLSLTKRLTELCTVSGHLSDHAAPITALVRELCPTAEVYVDSLGSVHAYLPAEGADAPCLLFEAHLDSIGLTVTGIAEGGFLRIERIGGIDTRTLFASDVVVYGREPVFGVITSIPPHLTSAKERTALFKTNALLIDTGLDRETLEKTVPIGSPVAFTPCVRELSCGRIAAPALDNHICCAAAILALARAAKSPARRFALSLLLTEGEETGCTGVRHALRECRRFPDMGVVLDTQFGVAPAVERRIAAVLGEGVSLSFSALSDRRMTKAVLALAKESGIPVQVVSEAGNLGTDGNRMPLCEGGVPIVNMGLPIRNMHTPAEVCSLADAVSLTKLLVRMTEEDIAHA